MKLNEMKQITNSKDSGKTSKYNPVLRKVDHTISFYKKNALQKSFFNYDLNRMKEAVNAKKYKMPKGLANSPEDFYNWMLKISKL